MTFIGTKTNQEIKARLFDQWARNGLEPKPQKTKGNGYCYTCGVLIIQKKPNGRSLFCSPAHGCLYHQARDSYKKRVLKAMECSNPDPG